VIATSMLRTVSGGLEWDNLDIQRLLALPMQSAAQQALLTSVELAAVASTTVAILGTAIAYLLTRTRVAGRGALDVISMLPSAAPGVVIAVAVIIVWNQPFMPKGIYGSQWVLAIAYAIVFLPYGVRYAVAAMHAVPATLDDAGRTSGAGEVRRFRRLLLPLILPSIVSAWVLAFAIGMRELENSLIVRPPGTTTVSTYMWQNFAQGSVIDGMGMAVVSFIVTCAALVAVRVALGRTDPPLG
jgi:iron(III) transport system permease protein